MADCHKRPRVLSCPKYGKELGIKFSKNHFNHLSTKQVYVLMVACRYMVSLIGIPMLQ